MIPVLVWKENKDIQQILAASIGSGGSFMNNLTFLGFILVMFGLCGMNLYGNVLDDVGVQVRPNFDNFGQARP